MPRSTDVITSVEAVGTGYQQGAQRYCDEVRDQHRAGVALMRHRRRRCGHGERHVRDDLGAGEQRSGSRPRCIRCLLRAPAATPSNISRSSPGVPGRWPDATPWAATASAGAVRATARWGQGRTPSRASRSASMASSSREMAACALTASRGGHGLGGGHRGRQVGQTLIHDRREGLGLGVRGVLGGQGLQRLVGTGDPGRQRRTVAAVFVQFGDRHPDAIGLDTADLFPGGGAGAVGERHEDRGQDLGDRQVTLDARR